jgi:uncharacterized protein YciW
MINFSFEACGIDVADLKQALNYASLFFVCCSPIQNHMPAELSKVDENDDDTITLEEFCVFQVHYRGTSDILKRV